MITVLPPPHFAEEIMQRAGARTYQIIPGWFDETLPCFEASDPIALLRLDGDWYESTMLCLEHLFDRVAVGGVVIIDDYFTWDGCSRAVHDFLSRRSATERIHSLSDVCYMRKVAAR